MITMFDYQQKAFNLLIDAFKARVAALVVMATGLGKTIVAAFWAKSELKKKHRGLFLCHENGILEQAMKEFRKVIGSGAVFAPFFGVEKDFDADKADIVFASFQTYTNWKDAFFEDEFDFIIVDESHHGQAPTFKEVIQYFKPKKLLGITATPDRMDMQDIREIFGEEVVNYPLEEAVAKGWLTQVAYHILNDNLSHWKLKKIIKEVLEEGQRVSVKQINETIFIKKRDEEIARTIQEYAGSSKKVIIFCEKTEHADNFQSFLPGSLTYHSKVKGGAKENRSRLDAFRAGSLQYILAVDKFNEGIDVPDAEVIVFLRCTDSKTIFFQQLGRGLRKVFGKEKVIVLDFVANCERLAMVKEMAHRVKEFAGNNFVLTKDLLHVSGSNFDFAFSDEQVEILDLIKRINEPFYETWQEAGSVAKNMGILNAAGYKMKYKQDPKLPSNPNATYKDFPSWEEFLGGKKRKHYPTWEEASAVAQSLNIKTRVEYVRRYSEDSMLPAYLHVYANYPGWRIFIGKKAFYKTWQEASVATINLGIDTLNAYQKKYKKDCRLPSNPDEFYKEFPGWYVFLGKFQKDFYPIWKEASSAVTLLKIKSQLEYCEKYKCDPRLPGYPKRIYSDFPGWRKFLGKPGDYYPTWQEASIVAIALKIKSQLEYRKSHKHDSRLSANPDRIYKDFPGWKKFLGKE